ncbi:MAG: hypothetical protein V2I48_08735 [Xanthomonadales bacterium]|jgi:hypothetical protein|nr:hypothetical protein [Xanthomonadales bacterium]
MTDKPREPEQNQAFERELEAVQTAWDRMETQEPPSLVDQAVLNAARRDLEPRRKRKSLRWLGGFATATVAVLAVTVILLQEPQRPEPSLLDGGEFRRTAKPAVSLDESATLATEQAPLPAAEPRALTREAKREKQAAPVQGNADESDAMKSAITPGAIRADRLNMTPGVPAQAGPATAELAEAATVAEEKPDEGIDPAPRSAEDWIEQMLELREYGQMKRLAGEIAAFRHYYPDHPLPEELVEPRP